MVINNVVIETPKSVKELRKGQVIRLPEKSARLLIGKGKLELYEPGLQLELTPEQLESVYKDAVGEINRNYQPGTFNFIQQKYPERWNQSLEAENRLNQLWDDGKDLKAFQKAVSDWKEIELELIKLFRQDTKDKPLCLKCGSLGERYSAGYDSRDKFQWGWWCLNCNPYNKEN